MAMTWTEWEETYKPIRNPNNSDTSFWGSMFETFGDDLDAVKGYPNDKVWTLVDNNPNSVFLDVQSGFWRVNRMGYFVTEVPWTEDVLVSNDPSYREE